MNDLTANEWVCESCTLINVKSRATCAACGCSQQCGYKNRSKDDRLRSVLKPSNSPRTNTISPSMSKKSTHAVNHHTKQISRAPFNDLQCAENIENTWICENCLETNLLIVASCGRCERIDGLSKNACSKSQHASLKGNSSNIINSHRSQLLEEVRQREEENALKLCNKILQTCRILKSSFVDDAFPPITRSICGQREPLGGSEHFHQWMRPTEIWLENDMDNSWSVFRNPSPSDILQGTFGDCWLISALSVLAEHENLLKRILITQEYCPEGVYQVRLCKDGEWVVVVVDDLFPCNENQQPIVSLAKRKQLWVPLIEKAVAKLYGSYQALDGGYPVEGLALLTGQPCESIILEKRLLKGKKELEVDVIWAQLMSSREMQFLFSAGSGVGKLTTADYELVGLRHDHAYSILDVQLCEGNRILKMHDPQGKTKWRGEWSITSHNWTTRMRLLLEPENLPSGTFWISFDDMLKYFQIVDVCRIRDTWNEVRLNCKPSSLHHDHSTCFLLNVFEPTEMEMTFFVKNIKANQDDIHAKEDFGFGILVFHVLNDSIDQIGPLVAFEMARTCTVTNLRTMLQCGQYFIVGFQVYYHLLGRKVSSLVNECVMALHSSKQILIEEISAPKFLIADVFINMSISELSNTRTSTSKPEENYIKFYEFYGLHCVALVVENNHKHLSCLVTCEFLNDDDVIVSTRGKLLTTDKVPPKHRKVITVFHSESRTYTTKFKYEMIEGCGKKRSSLSNAKNQSPLKDKTHLEKLYVPRMIF